MSNSYAHVLLLMHATDKDSILRICLVQNGYADLADLHLIDQSMIDTLRVKNDAGLVTQLSAIHRKKLTTLIKWFDLAGHDYETKLLKVTSFDTLVNEVHDNEVAVAAKALASTTTTTTSTYTTDLAANFAKGIKLDPTQFPKLENRTNFVIWKRDMTTTTKMLGVWNIIDDSYTPQTPDEIGLYNLQQSWVYNALGKCLNTLNSKRIWKDHPDDARAVYLELRRENETVLKVKYSTEELEDAYKNYKWTPKYP